MAALVLLAVPIAERRAPVAVLSRQNSWACAGQALLAPLRGVKRKPVLMARPALSANADQLADRHRYSYNSISPFKPDKSPAILFSKHFPAKMRLHVRASSLFRLPAPSFMSSVTEKTLESLKKTYAFFQALSSHFD